jgi:outer membrane receptor protein involved in Fe transport
MRCIPKHGQGPLAIAVPDVSTKSISEGGFAMVSAKTIRRMGIVLLVLGTCIQMFGQATASSALRGTVVDGSGAAVSGAEVTVSSEATGVTRTVTTGSNGSYVVEPLQVGVYTVKVASKGFATASAAKVQTLVGATSTQNFTLKTGTATEIVEVTSEVPLVDQLKTDVSQNITPRQVEELPMIGRDVANLAYLAPGVKAADSYDPTKNRYAILSVNGQNGRNVNVTVNGIDNKDNTVGGPVMQLPLEAVQEFSISTQRFSAANGRSEGAAINMITKSGSNKYHGSVFGMFKDQAMNADQKLTDGTKSNPPYSRQWFGGSIGGPVVKDRLFGFFAIERQREHTSLAEDPTALSELELAAANGLQAQPSAVLPTPFFETRYNGRMDWRISDKHTAYVSYASQANNGLNDQSDGTGDLTNGNFTVNHMQVANLTLNSALTNSFVNQFTFGYQYWNNLIASDISTPLVTFPSASFGTNTNVPQQSYQRKWQFKDDVSKTWRNHTFKTGVDYLWEPSLGGFFEFSSTLTLGFGADPSCILAAVTDNVNGCGPGYFPQGFATPGAVTSMGIANGDPSTNVPGGTKQLGLYFQDDWKVARRLTLNLGLRWDRDYNMVGAASVATSATYKELAALNNPITNPYIQRTPHDDTKNFSPRIGFAYDMTGSGKLLLRGGFGLYYGNIFQNIPLFMEQLSNPTIFQQSLNLTSTGDLVPGTGKTLGQWQYGVDPLPTIPAPSSTLNEGSVGRIIDPNYKNPVTEEFNVGTSWQLSNSSVFELEYVHSLGLHENKTINIIQRVPVNGVCCASPLDDAFVAAGLPVLTSIRNEESIGRSHYDGVNFSFRKQMSNRFSVNANYTLAWANSFNGGGGSFRNYPRVAFDPFASYEYGPSPNDERHHVTISGIVDLGKGFQFSPILQFGSARPYDLTNSYNTLNTGGGTGTAVVVPVNDTKNYLWGTQYIASVVASGGSADQARQDIQTCFYSGQCTIAKFDPLRGDPFFQMDTRIAKNFKIGEGRNLQLIAQFLNLTNRANYGNNFHNDISNPANFGTPAGFINPTSTTIPRSFQSEFGARFTF